MILQLRAATGTLNRIAIYIEQREIVGALFTSDWQVHNEMFGGATDFEGRLIRLNRVLTCELPSAHGGLRRPFQAPVPKC